MKFTVLHDFHGKDEYKVLEIEASGILEAAEVAAAQWNVDGKFCVLQGTILEIDIQRETVYTGSQIYKGNKEPIKIKTNLMEIEMEDIDGSSR